MKVILLQNITGLGEKYDVKDVSDGYARNFLIPQKLAKLATPAGIKAIEAEKKRREQEKEVQKDLLKLNIQHLKETKIIIERKANEKGHLFDSLDPKDISKILKEKYQLDIPPKIIKIDLPDGKEGGPIKAIGDFKIKVGESETTITVSSH
ncbi:MAG: 50S ribosomal protein L9 [Candidatus Parcubacteria bacterium]|nr:50S ribosomal protein L9 [Candidatus Parcubacteria bacterium]